MTIRFAHKSLLGAVSLLAAGCASAPPPAPRPQQAVVQPPPVQLPSSAGVYKIGQPYQIDNVWYYPQEQPLYDETGIASWYGPNFYGRKTANGEIYDGNQFTAAHKTLPMPVNVRVTNLDNGRSLVVRVNDRGPFSRGRIIDLSRRSAEALGMIQQGVARVRVTYVGRADLGGTGPVDDTPVAVASALPPAPAGRVDSAALDVLPGVLSAPPPVALPPVPVPLAPVAAPLEVTGNVEQVPVPATTRLYVQVGAFTNITNARRLLNSLGGDLVISTIQRGGQTLYRVRSPALASVAQADAALARINVQAGGGDARIVVDQ
jgi:rare lipoprotein A